jgi:DNA-binding HxlR family transcriptional regulator
MTKIEECRDQPVVNTRRNGISRSPATSGPQPRTWDPVVLLALRAGPRSRMELLGSIGGISDKVLSETLRRLRRSGLVVRLGAPDRSVAYRLSELGTSLATGPLVALGQWATEHGDHVLAHSSTRRRKPALPLSRRCALAPFKPSYSDRSADGRSCRLRVCPLTRSSISRGVGPACCVWDGRSSTQ